MNFTSPNLNRAYKIHFNKENPLWFGFIIKETA